MGYPILPLLEPSGFCSFLKGGTSAAISKRGITQRLPLLPPVYKFRNLAPRAFLRNLIRISKRQHCQRNVFRRDLHRLGNPRRDERADPAGCQPQFHNCQMCQCRRDARILQRPVILIVVLAPGGVRTNHQRHGSLSNPVGMERRIGQCTHPCRTTRHVDLIGLEVSCRRRRPHRLQNLLHQLACHRLRAESPHRMSHPQ